MYGQGQWLYGHGPVLIHTPSSECAGTQFIWLGRYEKKVQVRRIDISPRQGVGGGALGLPSQPFLL